MKLNHKIFSQLCLTELGLSFLALLPIFPGPYHTIEALDASWQVVLEEAFFKHWQFGQAINFTGGPLSLLYTPTSIGHFARLQVASEALVLLTAIFSIFYAIRTERIWIKLLVLIPIFCGAASSTDGIFLVSVSAIAFQLLSAKNTKSVVVFAVSFLAILSLMKFSLAMLSIANLGAVISFRIWERKYRESTLILATYLLSIILIWIIIGQSPSNLVPFFVNSFSISSGYAWSMHLAEPDGQFLPVLFVLLFSSSSIFCWFAINRKNPTWWPIFLISTFSMYLYWKTGIIRFGTHTDFFLQGAALIAFLLYPFIKQRKSGFLWLSLNTIIFLVVFFVFLPINRNQILPRALGQSKAGLQYIGSGGGSLRAFTDLIPYVKLEHTLHKIKERVGDESIDVFRFHNGILILNELNYLPRPTIQNYPAYNDHLARLNLKHMKENPPRFILCRDGSVDSRYPTTDDNLFCREVIENYTPVLTENEYLLLERTEKPKKFTRETTLVQSEVISGQKVDLSALPDSPLWLKVKYEPSILHKLLALLYKPEILILQVTTKEGEVRNFRLIGDNLKNGFLLSPKLETNIEIENFLSSEKVKMNLESFSIYSIPGNTLFTTKEFTIELINVEH